MKANDQDPHAEQSPTEQTGIGTPAAFAHLVRMHSPQIYRISLQMLKNHADAEDNLQNVLCKAYRSIDQFEGRSRISTWLFSIAINEALMRIRSRRTEPLQLEVMESESAVRMPTEVSDGQPNAERRYMAEELLAKVFAGLSPTAVDLFIRNKGEGWTHRELALEKGITIASVKSRIFKARERMQKKLRAIC